MIEGDQQFPERAGQAVPGPCSQATHSPRLQMTFGSRFPIFKTLQTPPSAQGGERGPRETLHLLLPIAALVGNKQADSPFPACSVSSLGFQQSGRTQSVLIFMVSNECWDWKGDLGSSTESPER